MKILLSLLIVLSFQVVFAKGTPEPPIKKGASVQMKTWDATAKAVDVKIVNEPEVGPNFADADEFLAAIGFNAAKIKEAKKDPSKLKGVVFTLKTNLKLLNYNQLKARLPKHLRKEINQIEKKGRKKAAAEAKKKKKKKTK